MPAKTDGDKLDEMLEENVRELSHVMAFSIADDQLMTRILGRWVHPPSGRSYHSETAPPKEARVDDITGEPLVQRSDDNEESLRLRLAKFHSQTTPVIEHYRQQGKVTMLDATQPASSVLLQIVDVLISQ